MSRKPKHVRTNVYRFVRSRTANVVLGEVGERVSRLWNAANHVLRQRFLTSGSIPSYGKLCELIPTLCARDYEALPSDIAQETLKKLSEAWTSFFELRKRHARGKLAFRPGLPKYRKFKDGTRPRDLIPIKSSRSCTIADSTLAMTLPADMRSPERKRLVTSVRGKTRYSGQVGRIELVYDKADRVWRAIAAVTLPERALKAEGRAAAIDLGMRVTAALSIQGQHRATLFSGREMLKEFSYWTRRIATHQAELATRQLKVSQQLLRLYATRKRRIEHALRAMAAAIAGICRAGSVRQVFIGWPKGIRDDVKVCKDWRGKLHNYWNFDRASAILQDALERIGIEVKRVGERGTSSTCPWTLERSHQMNRSPRWKLACADCGNSMHSDAAGALNILQFQIPGLDRDAVKATAVPRTFEWNAHSWARRTNRSALALPLAA